MKKFFEKHPDLVLISLAFAFSACIVGLFAWGVGDVISEMNRGLRAVPPQEKAGFDLKGAKALDLRGLVEARAQTQQ